MHDLLAFANVQKQSLKAMYGLRTDADLANVCALKLQEEVGEVVEAYLTLRDLQRPEKMAGTASVRLSVLGGELADVIIVVSILAACLGIKLEQAVAVQIRSINARNADILQQRSAQAEEVSQNQLAFPLFADL